MAVRTDLVDGVDVVRSKAVGLGVGVVAFVVAGVLAASALATTRSERSLRRLNHQVLDAVNSFRIAHGLHPLRESTGLDSSARQHSVEMGRLGYFAHNSADGTSFWRRIQRYYGSRNYAQWSVGENLLWAAPSIGAARAMKMWIASPEHLRNLMTPQWRQLGVSAVHVAAAPGVYGGHSVTIITTDFGVRR
jgi:uncharacterized protein YkwD